MILWRLCLGTRTVPNMQDSKVFWVFPGRNLLTIALKIGALLLSVFSVALLNISINSTNVAKTY